MQPHELPGIRQGVRFSFAEPEIEPDPNVYACYQSIPQKIGDFGIARLTAIRTFIDKNSKSPSIAFDGKRLVTGTEDELLAQGYYYLFIDIRNGEIITPTICRIRLPRNSYLESITSPYGASTTNSLERSGKGSDYSSWRLSKGRERYVLFSPPSFKLMESYDFFFSSITRVTS